MSILKHLKKDFPIFNHDPSLVYLDSTATSLKPLTVVNKLKEYYEQYSANIFRGVYHISEKATAEYEETRKVVAQFIGAENSNEVIFTRNTTESINLIAYALGREIINEGDEIVTTVMEHHSNFVPWQTLAGETGALLKVIDVTEDGYLNLDLTDDKTLFNSLKEVVTAKTKIVAFTYVSNVLGTTNPVKRIISTIKQLNPQTITVIDAAQAVPHHFVDVSSLGADFIAFSSHKMLGPTGVGILWGKLPLLKSMYPFLYGGEMIQEVTLERSTFKEPPHKYEAGTPNIAEVIALKEAVYYLSGIGMDKVRDYEKQLVSYAMAQLKVVFKDKIKLIGPSRIDDRAGIIALNFGSYHPHDVAQILDEDNIAIRAGHHCAMPLHKRYSLPASCRASFYIYNDERDVDKLIEGLRKVEKILK